MTFTNKSNSIGALASGLCLAHCIATPLIFMLSPVASQVEGAPVWWKSLDYVFLIVSFFAVYWSGVNTSKKWVRNALWISFIALAAAIFNEKFELLHLGELVVYIPAVSLIVLHLYNRKYCHCADETCCASE